MNLKFSETLPVTIHKNGSGITLNYNIKETPMEEIEKQWILHREGVDGDTFAIPEEWFIREHKYMYNELHIQMGQWKYDGVVEAIIRDKYSIDQMEAITNNMSAINAVFMQTLVSGGIVEAIKFLRESADTADTETFREMQEWRAMAKREAKKIFGV